MGFCWDQVKLCLQYWTQEKWFLSFLYWKLQEQLPVCCTRNALFMICFFGATKISKEISQKHSHKNGFKISTTQDSYKNFQSYEQLQKRMSKFLTNWGKIKMAFFFRPALSTNKTDSEAKITSSGFFFHCWKLKLEIYWV